MTRTNDRGEERRAASSSGGFFLPDLCATGPVVVMVILAELLVVVYALGDSQLPAFAWSEFALVSLFVQWIVLLSAAVLCGLRQRLSLTSLPLAVSASLLTILLVTLVSSLIARAVLAGSINAGLDGWWLLRNLLMAALIGGIVLRYFYLQQQLRLQEQAELTARIESLRAKIRPHFLFNTMNSIASLIGSRPEEAEQVVEDLSELFRANLLENNETATVADEMRLCELYLRIEQLRLGERMRVRWDLAASTLSCALPALLLQPLVENAVYHGVARLPEGGEIAITAAARDGAIIITVTNPLPPSTDEPASGHQMALDNIRQRLEAHYGGRAALDIRQTDQVYTVILTIPGNSEVLEP
jgi:two-component system sensor histidine kinase AlgZ